MDGLSAASHVDTAIARAAERQHGVLTRAQLREAGLSNTAVDVRVRAGRLHRLHRGVYAVGHRALRREGLWLAAVLAAGPGAALSHRFAAALWGLLAPPPPDAPVDVVTASTAGRKRRRGLRVHRSLTLGAGEMTTRLGIPVTTPARTLADLEGTIPEWQLHRAVNQAEVDGLLGREELEALFPGVADGTRSANEQRFVSLCRRHGIAPLPQANVVVGGRLVDAYFPGERLAIEIDSVRYHGTATGFHRDRRRGNDVQLAGLRLLRFTDHQVWKEPAYVVRTVKAARAGA